MPYPWQPFVNPGQNKMSTPFPNMADKDWYEETAIISDQSHGQYTDLENQKSESDPDNIVWHFVVTQNSE
jgi:hypothetical protein